MPTLDDTLNQAVKKGFYRHKDHPTKLIKFQSYQPPFMFSTFFTSDGCFAGNAYIYMGKEEINEYTLVPESEIPLNLRAQENSSVPIKTRHLYPDPLGFSDYLLFRQQELGDDIDPEVG